MVKEGVEKIVILHDKLYSGILKPYIPTDYPFAPHITLGDFAKTSYKLLEKAYLEAQAPNFNIRYKLDTLTMNHVKEEKAKPNSRLRGNINFDFL